MDITATETLVSNVEVGERRNESTSCCSEPLPGLRKRVQKQCRVRVFDSCSEVQMGSDVKVCGNPARKIGNAT